VNPGSLHFAARALPKKFKHLIAPEEERRLNPSDARVNVNTELRDPIESVGMLSNLYRSTIVLSLRTRSARDRAFVDARARASD
jgi:hypothetical protein